MIRGPLGAGVLVVAGLLLLAPARMAAHPGSTTSVLVVISADRAVRVELHTDARALVTKLEAASHAPLSPDTSSSTQLRARLSALADVLVAESALSADGQLLALRLGAITVDDTGQSVIELHAPQVPAARSLTWSTSVVYGAYPVALRTASGREAVQWVQGRAATGPLALDAASGPISTFAQGVWLGFTHIVPHGLDHILFVVGLVLLCARPRDVLLQVSAFTLAHSVTLGLSVAGWASAPPLIVEPLIALSVAYVGIENVVTSRPRSWRLAVVFAFGLLHGLGFAGALGETGWRPANLFQMLASFNIGVELGQLAVIALVVVAGRLAFRARRQSWRRPVIQLASAAVGITGLAWTVERIVA